MLACGEHPCFYDKAERGYNQMPTTARRSTSTKLLAFFLGEVGVVFCQGKVEAIPVPLHCHEGETRTLELKEAPNKAVLPVTIGLHAHVSDARASTHACPFSVPRRKRESGNRRKKA